MEVDDLKRLLFRDRICGRGRINVRAIDRLPNSLKTGSGIIVFDQPSVTGNSMGHYFALYKGNSVGDRKIYMFDSLGSNHSSRYDSLPLVRRSLAKGDSLVKNSDTYQFDGYTCALHCCIFLKLMCSVGNFERVIEILNEKLTNSSVKTVFKEFFPNVRLSLLA